MLKRAPTVSYQNKAGVNKRRVTSERDKAEYLLFWGESFVSFQQIQMRKGEQKWNRGNEIMSGEARRKTNEEKWGRLGCWSTSLFTAADCSSPNTQVYKLPERISLRVERVIAFHTGVINKSGPRRCAVSPTSLFVSTGVNTTPKCFLTSLSYHENLCKPNTKTQTLVKWKENILSSKLSVGRIHRHFNTDHKSV